MLEKNNNIDKLFSGKLYDYQENTSDYVFENIQNELNIRVGKVDIDKIFSEHLSDYQETPPNYVFENIQNEFNIKAGKTNIDKLFADNLNNYQEIVPKYIYPEISHNLKQNRKKQNLYKLQRIAATIAILIAFGLGYFSSRINERSIKTENNFFNNIYWFQKDKVNDIKIAKEEENFDNLNTNNSKKDIDSIENSNIDNKKSSVVEKNKQNNSTFLSEFKNFTNNIFISNENNNVNYSEKSNNKSKTAKYNQLLADTMYLADENYYREFLSANDQNKKSRWTFGTKFSPVFSFSKKNEQEELIDESDNSVMKSAVASNIPEVEFNEKPLTTFTSGLNVNFQISKRWSVQSGLYYSKRRQISENLMSSSFSDENQMRVFTPTGNKYIDKPFETMNSIEGDNIISRNRDETFYSFDMNYISNFKYIELPIIFRFKLIDRKIDLELLSGVSTNFLVGNKASIMIDEQELWKGVNEDISPLLYDATFGFGLHYNFYDNFNFSLEPTFKYTLVKQNANIQNYPYRFAVFAGFSYTF